MRSHRFLLLVSIFAMLALAAGLISKQGPSLCLQEMEISEPLKIDPPQLRASLVALNTQMPSRLLLSSSMPTPAEVPAGGKALELLNTCHCSLPPPSFA